jgi:Protein of unknown function (DUF4232)
MRTTPVAVTAALVAALALTACSSDSGDTGEDTSKSPANDKPAACKADQFTIGFGPSNAAPAAGDTGNIPVTLTNQDSTCVLQGVPATDLHAGGQSWAVSTEESAAEPKLTLAKGAAANFTITYVRGVAGDAEKAAEVDQVTFTLPGDKAVQSYKWPDAEVAVKSESELDATVSPFRPVGD